MNIETPGDPYGKPRASVLALGLLALLLLLLVRALVHTADHAGTMQRAAMGLPAYGGWIAALYVVWWLRPASKAAGSATAREIRCRTWRRALVFAVLSAPAWAYACGAAWVFAAQRDLIIAACVWIALTALMAWAVTGDRLILTPSGLERRRWVPRDSAKWAEVRQMEVRPGSIVFVQPNGKSFVPRRFTINNRFLDGWPEVAAAALRHVPPHVIDASGGREILEKQAALLPAPQRDRA